MQPVDEWEEKVKIVVGYYKFNISRTTHQFQIIIPAFERSISLDALQRCNLINIDPDMTILASRIATQFRGSICVLIRNVITKQPLISFSL
jgi:hypothetical protein